MNKKIPAIIAVLSVVVAAGGIAIGVRANREKMAAQEEAAALRAQLGAVETASSPAENVSAPVAVLKDASTLGTNDVAELQEQLAARDAELARLRAALEDRQNNPRQSFQDRMAQLKEEDPERYAEIIKNRAERQEQMRYDQANRLAAFVNMDTSMMSEEELANHNLLIEKLSGIWEQTAAFDPEQPPDREAMREFFGSMREIGEMMDMERTVMFRQLGSEVGLSGTETVEFASYVDSIIENTSMRPPRGMGGRPRDGGGNGGGGN